MCDMVRKNVWCGKMWCGVERNAWWCGKKCVVWCGKMSGVVRDVEYCVFTKCESMNVKL